MKINGYLLRETRKRWMSRRDVAAKTFKDSLWQFKGDGLSLKPEEIATNFKEADEAVAALEEAQQKYNQQVNISVAGRTMTLALAIKQVGGAARLAKMWSSASTDTGSSDRYYGKTLTRNASDVHAQKMVDPDRAVKFAEESASYASKLRSEIATANAKMLDIDIDPKYFE